MRSVNRVVRFPVGVKPQPAKAQLLRPDIRLSVARSCARLPVLGQCDPDGALLVEDLIEDWIDGRGPTNGVERASRTQKAPTPLRPRAAAARRRQEEAIARAGAAGSARMRTWFTTFFDWHTRKH